MYWLLIIIVALCGVGVDTVNIDGIKVDNVDRAVILGNTTVLTLDGLFGAVVCTPDSITCTAYTPYDVYAIDW